jgi:integrase/recombinase XerD
MLSTRDAKIIKMWTEKYPNPHTRYCYALDSERLLSHAKKPLSRITLGDLQAFAQLLSAAGLAPASRVRVLAAAKSLFGFCYRLRHIPANPAAELALPRYEVRLVERILSEEDVQRMLAVDAEPRDRVLLHLLYGGGLRVGEVCNLRWRNLRPHGEAGQITVYGKGGRMRSMALPAPLWSDITSLRGSAGAEEPVFPSRSGQALDRGRVRVIVRQAAEQAGIASPVSPHWLRHAHASHALDRGAPIHLVQATLGHSSVATTSAYLHARPGDSSARFLAPQKPCVAPTKHASGKKATTAKKGCPKRDKHR